MSEEHWLYKVLVGDKTSNPYLVNEQDLIQLNIEQTGDNQYHLIHNHKSYQIVLINQDLSTKELSLSVNGTRYDLRIQDKLDVLIEDMGLNRSSNVQLKDIYAPMPGLVLSVLVEVGDKVKDGDSLLVLEAMKMENVLKSPGPAIIESIEIQEGDSVDKGQLLISFTS